MHNQAILVFTYCKFYSVFDDGKIIGSGNIQTDGDELPDGTIVTKQCFFLNNDYVLGLVNKYLPLKD